MERKRKAKGGTERLRKKKKLLLASEARKCSKLANLFNVPTVSDTLTVQQPPLEVGGGKENESCSLSVLLPIAQASTERIKEEAVSPDVEQPYLTWKKWIKEEAVSSDEEQTSVIQTWKEGIKEEPTSSDVEQPSVTRTWKEGMKEEPLCSDEELPSVTQTWKVGVKEEPLSSDEEQPSVRQTWKEGIKEPLSSDEERPNITQTWKEGIKEEPLSSDEERPNITKTWKKSIKEEAPSSDIEQPSVTNAWIEERREGSLSSSIKRPSVTQTWKEGRAGATKSSSMEATTTKETKTDLGEGRSEKQRPMIAADLFVRPKENERAFFFQSHPIQPFEDHSLPFLAKRVFQRKNGSRRQWISYNKSTNALYCTICLAYSKANEKSLFIDGLKNWRHTCQRIHEHETSKHHTSCAEAHMQTLKRKHIGELLFLDQQQGRREEILNNKQVMERVVDVILLIGKRGLGYRGNTCETAHALHDSLLDHRRFLELLILLSKYDPVLKRHLDNVVQNNQPTLKLESKGCESALTFISKTMASNVIQVIASLIKKSIIDEVKKSGMFSLQLDTVQHILGRDQCSVTIRYVDNLKGIQERLLALVDCPGFTGRGVFKLLRKAFKASGLDINHCIGIATDGVANMQGEYHKFSTWLTDKSPGLVHVWSYSHILNRVISDTTQSPMAAASLFSLLNLIAAFFKESYIRKDVWDQIGGESDAGQDRRLQTIGETPWWARDEILIKIFGSFKNPKRSMYVDVILLLNTIEESEKDSWQLRAKARSYKEALLQYETIMTAFIYLRIFQYTTPLSKYLQTVGIDLLEAHTMVMDTVAQLEKIQRNIKVVKCRAARFIEWATEELDKRSPTHSIVIEEFFPAKVVRERKGIPGEAASDEPLADAFKDFEVSVYNIILDTTLKDLKSRFENNGILYHNLANLSPIQFGVIKTSLPRNALRHLSKVLKKFDVNITKEQLHSELVSLANRWDKLTRSLPEEYILNDREENVEDPDITINDNCEMAYVEKRSVRKRCKNCAVCVHLILERYNLFTEAYKNIGLAYKYLLTLSTSQVACERSSSTLNFIKSRLRSTLSTEHLEPFLLMSVEKDVLQEMEPDTIINNVALKSALLRKELYL